MGISLPQHLNNLFPIKDDATYFNSATKYSDSDNESQTSSMSTVDDKLEFIKPNMHFSHSQLECLECSSAESIKSSQGTGSSGKLIMDILFLNSLVLVQFQGF